MKIWNVVGISLYDYQDNCTCYAFCSTEEIAKRELLKAKQEMPEYRWSIEEENVLTE